MNGQRGDVTVTLDGREWVLRPSFEALVEIEERLGLGLVPLARRLLEGQFGLREITTVLACGIKGAGLRVPDDLGQMVVRTGLIACAEPVAQFVNGALQGDAAGNG